MQCLPIQKSSLRLLLLLNVSIYALQSAPSYAIDYGTFDARALSMGGAAVAIGTTSQAAFYNPALLAFHEGDEDSSHDGRSYLPTMIVQASDTLNSAEKAVNDKLDETIRRAITAYNSNDNSANAALIANNSRELRKLLNDIANKELSIDGFVGFSVSEPSDHEGGAFYVGVRAIGAGTSQVTPADLALLDEYIVATDQIAAGALTTTIALQHPILFNANAQLKDLTKTLTSSADASGLVISEWGLALAKEFNLWGHAVSFGITPKMIHVDAYRAQINISTQSAIAVTDHLQQFTDSKNTHTGFNADFGIAMVMAEHYRVSLASKDIFAINFNTKPVTNANTQLIEPGLAIKLRQRSRIGFGYVDNDLSIGLDYDLAPSSPIAAETPRQDISLGVEYVLASKLALRAGYKQDKTGVHSNLSSTGIGYHWHNLVMDIAYAQSNDMKGGALQLGWAF